MDLSRLFDLLEFNAKELGIDPSRLWDSRVLRRCPDRACQHAFEADMRRNDVCLHADLDGSTLIAQMAQQFGFANPEFTSRDREHWQSRKNHDRSCGNAFAGLNESIDAFVLAALKRNLPLTVINHAHAQHAFDLLDDTDETRASDRANRGLREDRYRVSNRHTAKARSSSATPRASCLQTRWTHGWRTRMTGDESLAPFGPSAHHAALRHADVQARRRELSRT